MAASVAEKVRRALLGAAAALLCLGLSAGPGLALSNDIIRVGVLEEPKSLNLWLANDTWSQRVVDLIYEPLYVHSPKGPELVPWLAAGQPQLDAANLTYTVKLRPAKWSDGSELTAADVVFTGQLIQNFQIPLQSSKWKFIKKVEALDKHTVRYWLTRPKAIFLTRTLLTPIVQKKQWEPVAKAAQGKQKPLQVLLRFKVDKPVGTGPFMLASWKKGVFVYLQANPHFFGRQQTIAGYTLGPYIKGMILKVFGTADAAVLALRKGEIDYYWNSIQPGYIQQIKGDPNIKLFVNKKSALYFLGFNLRKAPFNDVNFRRAVATLVSKEFIIKRILQGEAEVMHSLIPPGNEFYYNDQVPRYGNGLSWNDRVKAAYAILKKAGYTWQVPPVSASGEVVKGQGIRLPGGQPMAEFTILTPPADYDPHRAMSGQMIQEWLRAMGIPALSRPMAFGAMVQRIKDQRNFDCFVLGYAKLSLDPGYLRAFFHSAMDRPRGYNMSGYRNPDFDRVADESENAMDPAVRQKLIHKMQAMIMQEVPYVPLYNPLVVEGVRKDRFTGWVSELGGVGNEWSFCLIKRAK